ncbi:MAG: glycosyltransferase family 1 protein [Chloroflexota bacterium]|nr:MAG: glycosyltransferase family 1 protein [Chloroflexota bacterium]
MHIGFLSIESPIDAARGGGIAAYLRALIPPLIESGHQVTVIANARRTGTHRAHDGKLVVIHLRLPNLHWYMARATPCLCSLVLPLRQIEWSLAFYRIARGVSQRNPLAVLESTETGALLLAMCPLAPLVIRLHGSDYLFRRHTAESLHLGVRWSHRLEQSVLRRAQAVTSPSRSQAQEMSELLHWPADRIHVIPNPITPEMLAQADVCQPTLDVNSGAQTVLYVGRLATVKGVLPLLEAAQMVQGISPLTRFILVGPWQMRETPEQLGLQGHDSLGDGRIEWLDHLPWQQLVEWYRRATVFVMPSYYETFGISCLEAMAFGLPVVATTAGGLPEVVEDGSTGILVPPGNSLALATAIIRLLGNPGLRHAMGQSGKERVRRQFTAERVLASTLELYQTISSRSASLPAGV